MLSYRTDLLIQFLPSFIC